MAINWSKPPTGEVSSQGVSTDIFERCEEILEKCKNQMAKAATMLDQNDAISHAGGNIQRRLDVEKEECGAAQFTALQELADSYRKQMEEVPDAGVSFIEAEFDTCDLCLSLSVSATVANASRHTRNAWKAHDAIVRFLPRLRISAADMASFKRRIGRVRLQLERGLA